MAEDFDPLLVTLLVTDVLESLGAPYLIGGSLASILHGMVRTTNDADLVSDLSTPYRKKVTKGRVQPEANRRGPRSDD